MAKIHHRLIWEGTVRPGPCPALAAAADLSRDKSMSALRILSFVSGEAKSSNKIITCKNKDGKAGMHLRRNGIRAQTVGCSMCWQLCLLSSKEICVSGTPR